MKLENTQIFVWSAIDVDTREYGFQKEEVALKPTFFSEWFLSTARTNQNSSLIEEPGICGLSRG